jgi:hypothetical protein
MVPIRSCKRLEGSPIIYPMTDEEGRIKFSPIAILDRKLMKKGNKTIIMSLVQWSNIFQEEP